MGHVRVRNVGKAYRRYRNRWLRLLEWVDPDSRRYHEDHWVLRDVDFEITPGESLGIVGHNGSGKSTLLKIITGTTRATEGSVEVGGRIAALLELGMGFHPEFTGRQNAFMSGQLMGLTTAQIAERMPEIEAFAEIGRYIDDPLRTYSSGMQMRLAFSVATTLRPDVLIVDEALAVGDIYFQQKCFDRIQQYVRQGTTLLFVSHSMGTVLTLCDRAVLLKGGRIVHDGSPKEVIDLYQADLLVQLDHAPADRLRVAAAAAEVPEPPAAPEAVPEREPEREAASIGSITTPDATLVAARLLDPAGRELNVVVSGSEAALELRYRCHTDLDDPHVGFKVRDRHGVVLYETNTYCMGRRLGAVRAGADLVARFPFRARLAPGEYSVTAGFADGGYGEGSFRRALNYEHGVLAFTVAMDPGAVRWSGLVDLEPGFDATVSGP